MGACHVSHSIIDKAKMKKKYLFYTICSLLFVLNMQGCALQSSEVENLPGIDVEPDKINTDFTVYEDPVIASANTHKNNELLIVTIKNLGDNRIRFSPSGHVKIYAKVDDEWIDVYNAMSYPETDLVLVPTKDFPPGMDESVIPSISNMTEPTLIRIFLEGELVDTNEKVGAYLDVRLLP